MAKIDLPDEDETTPILLPKLRAEPPAASPPAGTRSVESWAEAKGMLPMELRAHGVAGAAAINPQYWKFAGARALKRWQDGEQVTEADFDAAVAETLSASCR